MKLLRIHYHRPFADYDGWHLWLWNGRSHDGGRPLGPAGRDDFGLVFEVDPDSIGPGDPIGLLPRRGNWEDRDGGNRLWRPEWPPELWLVSRWPCLAMHRPETSPFVVGGFIDTLRELVVELNVPIPLAELSGASVRVRTLEGRPLAVSAAGPAAEPGAWEHGQLRLLRVELAEPLDPRGEPIAPLTVEPAGYRAGTVWPRRVLDGPEFVSDLPLGAIVSGQETTFRVFAPTAAQVILHLYDAPSGGQADRFEMARRAGGVWEYVARGDLSGRWYTLSAGGPDIRFKPGREFLDPYARGVTAHGGRGLIVTDATPVADRPDFPPADAIIYEAHVRDLTISTDSGVAARGLFLGLAEEGTRLPGHPEIATGLDHLVELGINTVQLMPVQDFENDESGSDYQWGYMPVNFNSPDGWFATGRSGPERVRELKRLIDALHRKGLKVVMDVVYNHTAEQPPDHVYSFDGLAPGYYYRMNADGSFSNGSGTGNEFRSEAPMARRFLLDSLRYWVTEYKVDGFRFDLLGLIDLETMKRVVAELKAIEPNILLYGEPWTGGPTPIVPIWKGAQRSLGFGVFNDHFRDALKGDLGSGRDGFVTECGQRDRVRRGFEGSVRDFADRPTESVNYVECHDNQTLWDRLARVTGPMPGVGGAERIRMHRLAGAAVLLARGLPFLHAGQEMLRTKRGEENSYNLPDEINQVLWQWKAAHADVVAWYRGLIGLRRAHPLFRQDPPPGAPRTLFWLDEDRHLPVPEPALGVLIERGDTADPWDAAIVWLNPAPAALTAPLPPGPWWLEVDGDRVSSDRPLLDEPLTDRVELPARSAVVLSRRTP